MAQPEDNVKDNGGAGQRKMQLSGLFDYLKGRTLFRLFVLWLISYLVLLSFFFKTVLSNNSFTEIFPSDFVFPLLMHALTALIVTLAVYWLPWLKSFLAKAIAAIIFSLLFVDYDSNMQAVAPFIKSLTPGLSSNDSLAVVSFIYLLILAGLAALAGYWADRIIRRSRLKSRDVQYGVLVLVGYLFLVPAFSMLEIMPSIIKEASVKVPELPQQKGVKTVAATDKPDIYYIILDRYTNENVLSSQFNLDNSGFTDSLREQGFHINPNAEANYPYTALSVSSTMYADYTNKLVGPFLNDSTQSRTLFHEVIQQSPVVKALKQAGYKYHAIGSWYGATYKAPLSDMEYIHQNTMSVFGVRKHLRGIEQTSFASSPYFRFFQTGTSWWPLKTQSLGHVDMVREQINDLDQLSKDKPGGRFIFAHILVPHDPFAFNSNGSISAYQGADNVGKPIKKKYTDQVSFINGEMKRLISQIEQHSDGKAVIAIQADEGAYPNVLNSTFERPQASTDPEDAPAVTGESAPTGSASTSAPTLVNENDMRTWPDDWLQMKYGILQAVRIPAASEDDLAHLTSVNLFRVILNKYAGYNLNYLPDCKLGLPNAMRTYGLIDITERLTGKDSQACQNLQTAKP